MSIEVKTGWSEADIPDNQTDKVVFITGANIGLGYEVARMLSQRGARVVMACRNQQKAEATRAKILAHNKQAKLDIVSLDLSDLENVAQTSAQLQKLGIERIDILLNNAGVMAPRKRLSTKQGFELQFGTNHLGHFALTTHLFPFLADDARIVNVSSLANERGDINWDDIQWAEKYSAWGAYRQSKTANLLFNYELNRRLQAINSQKVAVAAHPGVAKTNLTSGSVLNNWMWLVQFFVFIVGRFNGWRVQSAAMGALPLAYACTDKVTPGGFYGPENRYYGHPQSAEKQKAVHSDNPESAKRLWKISEELTGLKLKIEV